MFTLFFIYKSTSTIFLCVLVYVDDLVIIGTHPEAIKKFKYHFHACFHMKDLGPLKYFLGIYRSGRNSTCTYLCSTNMSWIFLLMQAAWC